MSSGKALKCTIPNSFVKLHYALGDVVAGGVFKVQMRSEPALGIERHFVRIWQRSPFDVPTG